SRVDGARRPRRLAPAGIDAMEEWLTMLRRGMEKSYDRLDAILASMEEPKKRKGDKR
ncbi:MAG: ArsR family transcriptional regulator, partial [Acidobacteria bacterium]|nr:ArsR family transcriptional regulator [Acidobacteriota bacterium]